MAQRFRNKYRISTTRLPDWDYGWNASYFVTICTGGRIPFFGKIPTGNPEMNLSPIGHVVFNLWNTIPDYFPYVVLDEFVIMPDHVHGIIVINKPNDDGGRGAINRTSTIHDTFPKIGGVTGNKNPMLHHNLSRIIRWFKGRTTFECRKTNADFYWQSGFHEHIIRNYQSHKRIKIYIQNNPINWVKN